MTHAAKMPKFCSTGTGDEAALTMKAAHVVTDVMSIARPARRKTSDMRCARLLLASRPA